MTAFTRTAGIFVFLLFQSSNCFADEPARFALLIGNQEYNEKIGKLKNPESDVALIETSLKKLGFVVTVLKNADYRSMDMGLKHYVREVNRAGPNSVSLFYYSGHGVANSETGINYLIPVDVTDPDSDTLWDEAYQQSVVIETLSKQAPRATHFVIFDACRNELRISRASSKGLASDKGFAPVQTTTGLLIAYATAPNQSASDVGEQGGPYARALAEEILKPGVEAVSMFRAVQIRVKNAINQDPWLSFPSLPEIYLAGRGTDQTSGGAITRTAESEAASRLARAFKDCDKCPELLVVNAGDFLMGSPENETGRKTTESPAHTVTIPHAIAVGRGPVTVGEFSAFIAASGFKPADHCREEKNGDFADVEGRTYASPGFPQDDGHPVVCVSWNDAQQYVNWLSSKTGKRYRLLSEAEREYAARAGTSTTYWWGPSASPRLANYDTRLRASAAPAVQADAEAYPTSTARSVKTFATAVITAAPVGGTAPAQKYPANAWGFYSVSGNAAEWVQDCWNPSYVGLPTDGSPATTGECTRRVLRGGGWTYWPEDIRSASRDFAKPDDRYVHVGFRVAREVE